MLMDCGFLVKVSGLEKDKGFAWENKGLPSHGSGSDLLARSSMENFTSCPFSRRDSGSAFSSQYCLPGMEVETASDVEVRVGA